MKKIVLFFVMMAVPYFLLQCFFTSDSYSGEGVRVKDAFAFPTLKGTDTGAAYLSVINAGRTDVDIVGADTPVADRAELHEHAHQDGVMKMRKVAKITLAAGETKTFEPGGLHVMLFGIKQPLEEGTAFPVTFTFAGGEKLTFSVKVQDRDIEPEAPAHSHH